MIRKIIQIEEKKCNGCGLCADACHEGAIGMVDGKAKLLRDDYCDGLGDCLPVCPMGAIHFVERETVAYDEIAVQANRIQQKSAHLKPLPCGCPGSMARTISQDTPDVASEVVPVPSQLRQWPVQIQLVSVQAPYLEHADLLIAADCTAYAYGNFHAEFMRGKVVLVGCPKLDTMDYTEKLTEILRLHEIHSITVVRMEVPCCGGLARAVENALQSCGRIVPHKVVTISVDGKKLSENA